MLMKNSKVAFSLHSFLSLINVDMIFSRIANSFIALTLIFSMFNCVSTEVDPVPVLRFQSSTLTCHLDDHGGCFNPVKSSIEEKIQLPDGSYILQSGSISISSSDPSIAEPNGNGFIIAKKIGKVVITAVQKAAPGYNAKGMASYTLTVEGPLDPTPELTWYQSEFRDIFQPVDGGVGDSIINYVTSSIVNGGEITYSSSNIGIATVTSNGIVKCSQIGEATITATQKEKAGVNQMTSTSFIVRVLPTPLITFTYPTYTCSLNSNEVYQNMWSTNMPGGDFSIYVDYVDARPIASYTYQGVITPIRAGNWKVTVYQAPVLGEHTSATGSFTLIILP